MLAQHNSLVLEGYSPFLPAMATAVKEEEKADAVKDDAWLRQPVGWEGLLQ